MRRLIRSTLVRVGVEKREEETRQSQEEEEAKQEEEPPSSPKRRCLGGGGEVTIKVIKAPTVITVQEEEKKEGGVAKEGKKDGRRKVVKGIDDMSMEELKGEMRRRKMKGFSKMKIQELRGKLKEEVNSQRILAVKGKLYLGKGKEGNKGNEKEEAVGDRKIESVNNVGDNTEVDLDDTNGQGLVVGDTMGVQRTRGRGTLLVQGQLELGMTAVRKMRWKCHWKIRVKSQSITEKTAMPPRTITISEPVQTEQLSLIYFICHVNIAPSFSA